MKNLSDKIKEVIEERGEATTGEIISLMLKKYPDLEGAHVDDRKFFGAMLNCKQNINKRWRKIGRSKWQVLLSN